MAEWLKMAENVKLLEWLEIAGKGWKWLEMAENFWNGWKCLEMAING